MSIYYKATDMRAFIFLISFLYCFTSLAAETVTSAIQFSATPAWVKPVKTTTDTTELPASGGIQYLLVDQQINASPNPSHGPNSKPTHNYYHFREKILNQNGLNRGSELFIYHYPDYQTIELHHLNIIRAGEVINKLSSSIIDSFRSETQSRDLIYSGEITTQIVIDDLREGDIIDYGYSTIGSNPVYQKLFSFPARLNWTVPVEQAYYRVLWRSKTPLKTSTINASSQVKVSQQNDFINYEISLEKIPAIIQNSQQPSWFNPTAYTYFSNIENWQDVEQWATPMYQEAMISTPALETIGESIKQAHTEKLDQLGAALDYVQSEIRYLGLEMGQNSHRPTPADQTLDLRYGDCKDKTTLLITLLRQLGINAYPALVNTVWGKKLTSYPPSHNNFDHVITFVELNGETFWLDPTRQNQGNNIRKVHQPDYGYALVLAKQQNSLTNMTSVDVSASHTPSTSIQYTYDKFVISETNINTAEFTTKSVMSGWYAENLINQVDSSNLDDISKTYLNYYQKAYPEIKITNPLVFNKENGQATSEEFYSIDNFWEKDEERYLQSFYPSAINSYLEKPAELERVAPFALSHPQHLKQTIEIHLNAVDWELDDETFVEENPYFFYQRDITFDPDTRKVTLDYEYKTFTDFVPADKAQDYAAAIDRLEDYLNFGLHQAVDNVAEDSSAFSQNMILILVALLAQVIILTVLASWIYSIKKEQVHDEFVYSVPIWQFIVLSLVTYGIYPSYWMYRNWKYFKASDTSEIMPIARAIFSVIWFFPLYLRLSKHAKNNSTSSASISLFFAAILTIIYISANFLGEVAQFELLSLILIPLVFIPAVHYVNSENSKILSRLHWRHALLSILTIPIMVYVIGSDLYLIPSENVVRGDVLRSSDKQFMERSGLFPADEKVEYFYSDAIFNVRKDGNGFTEKTVFSYWRDENDQFVYQTVALSEVSDIEVEFSNSWGETSKIKVITDSGDSFILYVGSSDKRDKLFVKELKKRWHQQRPSLEMLDVENIDEPVSVNEPKPSEPWQ